MKPLVSVVITTYNRAEYIERAIKSVLDQVYENIEIIVVNDCSTDNTKNILKRLESEKKIKVIENSENLKIPEASNKGIAFAKGKYIARLDDDDEFIDSQKIEKQVKFLEKNPDYVLAGGGMIKTDKFGNKIRKYNFLEKDEEIRKNILASSPFVHSTVLYRADAIKKVGGYEDEFNYFAEWDVWLKLGKIGKMYNFQEYFIHYLDWEINNSGYKRRNILVRRNIIEGFKLRNKYRKYYKGFVKSIILMIVGYFYSFVPNFFRTKFKRIFLEARKYIFGRTTYTYKK